jgi:glutathione S-transferase
MGEEARKLMGELVLTTYDWVPQAPRGFVRDLRVRWALEEAGLAYRVETTPFRDRSAAHFARQPFGQAPWLLDGDVSIFESGAILIYLGERSHTLMPADPRARAEVLEWVVAALNSIEMVSVPWSITKFTGEPAEAGLAKFMSDWLDKRLCHLEAVLSGRQWLAGHGFSIADILMADALRLVDRFDGLAAYPATGAYVARATARPAFKKAYADQMAHFAAAD